MRCNARSTPRRRDHAVENAAKRRPRLELDRQAVVEAVAGGREGTLVARIGQPRWTLVYSTSRSARNGAERHLELDSCGRAAA